MMAEMAAAAMSSFDTYQEAEDALSDAFGGGDPTGPNVSGGNPGSPNVSGSGEGAAGACPDTSTPGVAQGEPPTVTNPMNVLDSIPDYRPGDRNGWAQEVEDIAKKNPLTKDFTATDAKIIADYTGSWALDANKYLRSGEIGKARAGKIDEFIDKMDTALEHLPPIPDATLYRGTFMPQDMIDKFAAGGEVTMPEYLSTSTDIKRSAGFVDKAKPNPGGENVLVEIKSSQGRNIDPLSRYRGVESEVLIPRDGKFKQVGTETKIIDGKKYEVMILEQVN